MTSKVTLRRQELASSLSVELRRSSGCRHSDPESYLSSDRNRNFSGVGGKIASKLFSHYPEIVFGFSTKKDGDMSWKEGSSKTRKNRELFFKKLGINPENVISMYQPHDNRMKIVSAKEKSKKIKGVDGLITNKAEIFLQITVADCIPIFLYDAKAGIIAIAHAGWKGTAKNVASKTVKGMEKIGSNPQDIIVFLGPSIKQSCYDVSAERYALFKKWGSQAVRVRNGKYFLDLPNIVISQLKKESILEKNLEVSPLCTSCNKDFYSHHRDKKIEGLMVGVIGRR